METNNADCLNSRLKYRPSVGRIYKFLLFASFWVLFRSALFIRKLNIKLFNNGQLLSTSSIPTHTLIIVFCASIVATYSLSQFFNDFKNVYISNTLSWDAMHERKSFRSIKARSQYLSSFIHKQIPQPNVF